MKEGNRLGSSLASAFEAFASVGVEGVVGGACSFSMARGAAVLLLGSKGSNVLLLLGSKQGLERAPNPHANYTADPPLAGGIPGRARGLGPRDIEARAASVANGRALAEAASKPIERRGTRAGSFSGSVAFIHPPDARPLGPGQRICTHIPLLEQPV